MSYAYVVRDPMGRTLTGEIEAVSHDEAKQKLRHEGFQVVEISEEEEGVTLFRRGISLQDLIYVTAQLAIMVDTGITLSVALGGIIQQESNVEMKKVLQDLKMSVESGDDFSSGLERYPKLFNKTYVSLVKASEATGALGEMLEIIAGYLRKELDTRNKVRGAMAYPMVMMVMACGVTLFLITYILPKFTPIFESRGADLPMPTKLLMGVSHVFLEYWYLWIVGLVASGVGIWYSKQTEKGRRFWDGLKLDLPILGTMFRKVALGRSIRTLGTLLASGVPVMEAIRLAGEVSGNYYYEELWNGVLKELANGKRICEALQDHPLFPRVLVQMISAGEETGKLEAVLAKVSTYYESEVESTLKTTTSLIEPLMIAMMGIVVGTIGMALMLPIFSLSRPG